jgi:hypothetical protein
MQITDETGVCGVLVEMNVDSEFPKEIELDVGGGKRLLL